MVDEHAGESLNGSDSHAGGHCGWRLFVLYVGVFFLLSVPTDRILLPTSTLNTRTTIAKTVAEGEADEE